MRAEEKAQYRESIASEIRDLKKGDATLFRSLYARFPACHGRPAQSAPEYRITSRNVEIGVRISSSLMKIGLSTSNGLLSTQRNISSMYSRTA